MLLVVAACAKPEEPAAPPDQIDVDNQGGTNLLNLARGASVISRTAEQSLDTAAAHAIDGDGGTFWRSPAGGAEQTMTFALPARSRIDRVGVLMPRNLETCPRVRFEASENGVAWQEIKTLDLTQQDAPQIASVPPFDASYLRVTTLGLNWYVSVRSVIAKGQQRAVRIQPPLEGCWRINGQPARFSRRGTSIAGVIGSDPPIYVLGGTDGRIVRLNWLRGPMWGPAIVTIDPLWRTLTGLRWHERVRYQNSGDAWFGTPAQCNEVRFNETEIAAAMLKRAGTWTAYGESALDTLAELVSRPHSQTYEIVVRTPQMRDALRARGINVPISVTPSNAVLETQRVMADGVELRAR
ncbi:MAG TPA: discoidin domain-containing protein [Thermoanaerobaculia bacterium]|nr:discoidin domain-containing protein [Thermoanaerobaculia bacterium]